MQLQEIKDLIRSIPNYPKEGILFRDLTTLFKHPVGFHKTIDQLQERYSKLNIDVVVGVEARGFIVGSALAYSLKKGFVPIRKKGKLPGQTVQQSYSLEYGEDTIEIHDDSLQKGQRVLLVDDLMATGGTAMGSIRLIEQLGAKIEEVCCLVDLPDLGGGEKLKKNGYKFFTVHEFPGH
jgi:adenine phosphoribosyltransferase